nr:CHASE2 domain-containing protein [candidate division Zixibacteria bacterium]NIR63519.1 CHASE2 domain-containing protein [candidate division Zixibacteria bacterium]NIS46192.1 CHASE2 domain-containing protein [candidate division Zixibacteria bacterium]NIT52367.1 CHASE2 domain-containing protein [candidate division Zixibacteria bacterium]NIU14294.1 CHASE2 domain-containing protein [candidate division Zixibacteria bacterium]
MRKKAMSVLRSIFAGSAAGILIAVLFMTGVFELLELKALDFRFRMNAEERVPSDDIVIVTIDQNSIDYLKNRIGILWKWPRDLYGYAVSYLSGAGAKAILLDFDFSDPDINRAEFEEGQTDRFLGEAIEEAGNVVNTFILYDSTRGGDYAQDTTDYELLEHFALNINGSENLNIKNHVSAVVPIPVIMGAGRSLGSATIHTDPDGTIRR